MTDQASERLQEHIPHTQCEQPENAISQPPQRVDLDYPQILLDASFASLLTHSFPSTSSGSTCRMASLQPPDHGLGESWASLSNSSYTCEDDVQSENTDAASLVDMNGSDDVHSLDDLGTSSESGEPTSNGEELSSHDQTAVFANSSATVVDESSRLTPAQSQYLESIEFEEPEQWPDVGDVDLRRTLKILDDEEVKSYLHDTQHTTNSTPLVGAIRMSMSRIGLQLDQPFRVLFHGTASDGRAEILRKIGDALVSTTDFTSNYRNMEYSRYHVVPLEFGPGSPSNQAEMIPIQTQIIVDDCVEATSLEDSSGDVQIILALRKGDLLYSRWDGVWQNILERRRWTAPNIAIILLKSDDSIEKRQVARLVYDCMVRHNVPTLVICEDNAWVPSPDFLNLDHQTLHRSIESQPSNLSAGHVLKRLPIDIDTFINLDPEQLNKHFSCLGGIALARNATRAKSVSFGPRIARALQHPGASNDVEKNLSRSIMAQRQTYDLLRTVTQFREAVMLVLALLLFGWMFLPLPQIPFMAVHTNSSPTTRSLSLPSPVLSTATRVATISTNHPTHTQIQHTNVPAVRGQSDLAKLLSSPLVKSLNTFDKFLVEVIGDCHVIVKAPREFVQRRKEPDVRIRVTRGNEEVESHTSKLFEGVYSVKVPREHAHGQLNATITVAKSSIKETFVLDFGEAFKPGTLWGWTVPRVLSDNFPDVPKKLRNISESWQNSVKQYQLLREQAIARNHVKELNLSERAQQLSDFLDQQTRGLWPHKIFARYQLHATQAKEMLAPKLQHIAQVCSVSLLETKKKLEGIREEQTVVFQEKFESVVQRAKSLDLSQVREIWQDFIQSESLAKAQERARRMVSDSADKLKKHRLSKKGKGKGCGRKKCRKGRKPE